MEYKLENILVSECNYNYFKHALFMLFSILNEHRTMHVLAKPAYHYDQAQFTCRPVSQQEVEC